jgi:hypothetical protein
MEPQDHRYPFCWCQILDSQEHLQVFSTITSTGGGKVEDDQPCGSLGINAGLQVDQEVVDKMPLSGNLQVELLGSGNTPPVSPAQGFNGGAGNSD